MSPVQVHLPGPLGMIVAGIILRNVNNGNIIAGLKPSWSREFRDIALAIIFLRSGLELDLGVSHYFPPLQHAEAWRGGGEEHVAQLCKPDAYI